MELKITHITLLLMLFAGLNGQRSVDVQIETWMNTRLAAVNAGIDPGSNGAGLAVGINKQREGNLYLSTKAELGAAGIGNYVAVSAGIGRQFRTEKDQLSLGSELRAEQGLGFFRPSPIYLWGISQDNFVAITNKKGTSFGLLIGFRFYGYPGYSQYSEINHFFDLKTGLRVSF